MTTWNFIQSTVLICEEKNHCIDTMPQLQSPIFHVSHKVGIWCCFVLFHFQLVLGMTHREITQITQSSEIGCSVTTTPKWKTWWIMMGEPCGLKYVRVLEVLQFCAFRPIGTGYWNLFWLIKISSSSKLQMNKSSTWTNKWVPWQNKRNLNGKKKEEDKLVWQYKQNTIRGI